MTDTPETLKAALADMRRDWQKSDEAICEAMDRFAARVAAFEKARVEEEEPPVLTDATIGLLEMSHPTSANHLAARRLRYCERELARLREGLRRQEGEMPDRTLSDYMDNPERVPVFGAVTYRSECVRMAREIQRHRKLVAK